MKILIGAACVVVIATSVWALEDRLIAHKRIAEEAEFDAWYAKCLDLADDIRALRMFDETIMRSCLFRGGQPMQDLMNRAMVDARKTVFQ